MTVESPAAPPISLGEVVPIDPEADEPACVVASLAEAPAAGAAPAMEIVAERRTPVAVVEAKPSPQPRKEPELPLVAKAPPAMVLPQPAPPQFDAPCFAVPQIAAARAWEITPPRRDDAMVPFARPQQPPPRRFGLVKFALIGVFALGWVSGLIVEHYLDVGALSPPGRAPISSVVERIIYAESNGDPNLKNKRSSATGLGQFIDGTWLELMRAHRPNLVAGRSEKDILQLRYNPELVREMTSKLAEQNAAALRKQGLSVTPSALYLAHFAGAAGAAAILSARDDADAASLIANADATGRLTREKIVAANPFLRQFTAADLRSWADRKMRGRGAAWPDPGGADLAMSGAASSSAAPLSSALSYGPVR